MCDKSNRQIWQLLGVAVLLNALMSTVLMLSAVPSDIWLTNASTGFFLPAALLAHFSFLFFTSAIIALFAHLIRIRGLTWHLLTLLLFSTLIFVVILDIRIFSLYRFHLNAMSLNLLFGGATLDILSFSWAMWIRILLIALFVIGIESITLKWLFKQDRFTGKNIWPTILTLMISTQLFYSYRDAIADTPVIMQMRYIPWALPFTVKKALRKLGVISDISDRPSLRVREHSAINYPVSPLACEQPAQLNYLVLMVDSVRADMLNSEVMPNTYAFSHSAQTFNQHWSTSNSTRFGLFGFFYGLPGTYWFDMLNEQRGAVLFDVLQEHDYQFHIDAAAPLNSPQFDQTIFSNLRNELQWVGNASDGNFDTAEADTVVIRRLLKFLDQDHDKNFFAFTFLDAPHGYKIPRGEAPHFQPAIKEVDYLALNNDYDATAFFNLYKSTIHYDDRLLGKVYEKLIERDLLKNTVIIISSDHGQEFNDLKLNYWGHNGNFSEYQVKVPLLIYWPGKEPQQISRLTSHEDIIPTLLLHGLNCKNRTTDYSTGFSLFEKDDIPLDRSLLLTNWGNRAIYTGDAYYHFPDIGNIEVLDHQYRMKDDQSIEHDIIRQNMANISRYIK